MRGGTEGVAKRLQTRRGEGPTRRKETADESTVGDRDGALVFVCSSNMNGLPAMAVGPCVVDKLTAVCSVLNYA